MTSVTANSARQSLGIWFANHTGRSLLLLHWNHDGTGLSNLFGRRDRNSIGLFNVFHVRNINGVALLNVFGVRNRDVVGLLNRFRVRNIDRVGLRYVLGIRNANGVILSHLFLVGNINRVVLGLFRGHWNRNRILLRNFFRERYANGVVLSTNLLLRNHHSDRTSLLFGYRDLMINGELFGARLGTKPSAGHGAHFGGHLVFINRLGLIHNGRAAATAGTFLGATAATTTPRRTARIAAGAGDLAAATWVIGIGNATNCNSAEHCKCTRESSNHKHVLLKETKTEN